MADGDVGALAFIRTTYRMGSQGSCTGTLVAPTWVLTAAHCVQLDSGFGDDSNATRVEVMLGSNDSADHNQVNLPPGVELHDAVGWVIHGNYDDRELVNDVALIKLPRASNQPVMGIATDESLVTASGGQRLAATAYGFGQNCSLPPCADDTLLRSGPTEIVSDEAAEGFIGRIDDRMKKKVNFLLPEVSTQAAICFGDSGGPLTVMQNGVEVVAGVNSFIADADRNGRTCQPTSSGIYLNGVADVVASSLHDYVSQVLEAPPLTCFDRTVTLVGTSFPDRLVGTGVVNVMHGRGDNDILIGAGGADRLCGGPGLDIINGGRGADRISGGSGFDTIDGGRGADTINGGKDADVIEAGGGADTVNGGRGADVIFGGPGQDDIEGKKGDDTIDGGSGDDTINGNSGIDTCVGGTGSNTIAKCES